MGNRWRQRICHFRSLFRPRQGRSILPGGTAWRASPATRQTLEECALSRFCQLPLVVDIRASVQSAPLRLSVPEAAANRQDGSQRCKAMSASQRGGPNRIDGPRTTTRHIDPAPFLIAATNNGKRRGFPPDVLLLLHCFARHQEQKQMRRHHCPTQILSLYADTATKLHR